MLPITIRSPPSATEYTALADYQSQTPESFVEGKHVLHYHLKDATALIPESERGHYALFPADSTALDEEYRQDVGSNVLAQRVEVFVSSEYFTLYSSQTESGISIPYPAISIHAVKQLKGASSETATPAVYMQLEFSSPGSENDDQAPEVLELTIIPAKSESESDSAAKLYEAIATCSNLHPDPVNGDEEGDEEENYDRIVFEGSSEHHALDGFSGVLQGAHDGGLPPPMPGSGGWITAENMHEYFDEDGNWIGENGEDGGAGAGELGAGAGRIRDRDEVDLNADKTNGDCSSEDTESKRPRLD